MRKNLIILEFAERDIFEALAFYEQHSKTAREGFLFVLDTTFSLIRNTADAFPYFREPIRKCVIEKFPFIIYYFEENDTIFIIAIFHTKRNPDLLEKRTGKR